MDKKKSYTYGIEYYKNQVFKIKIYYKNCFKILQKIIILCKYIKINEKIDFLM